jgi:hypothetical protein
MEKGQEKVPTRRREVKKRNQSSSIGEEKKPRAWRQSGEWNPSRLKEGWDFWI